MGIRKTHGRHGGRSLNRHAFLPGDMACVKIGPRWRLWARTELNEESASFPVASGSVALVLCVFKDVRLSDDIEDTDDFVYMIVEGRHAFIEQARLEPA